MAASLQISGIRKAFGKGAKAVEVLKYQKNNQNKSILRLKLTIRFIVYN